MNRGAPAPVRPEHWRARGRAPAAMLLAFALACGFLLALALGPGATAARGELVAFRDRIAPPTWPPWMLVRAEPAVPLSPRVLGLRATYESFTYPDRAADATDPALALLAGGRVDRIGLDVGYGLGAGLTARGRLSFLAGDVAGAESSSGFEDATLALSLTRPVAGERLRARLTAGAWLPIGSDAAFSTGDGLAAAPFSAGATRPFAGAGDAIAPGESPQSLSPGFALRVAGVEVGAAADLLLASDDDATAFDPRLIYPEWALRIRIGTDLVPRDADHDGDGVGDLHDGCPRAAEDRDGFLDGDGCPDPDNDGDGISDAVDACPNAPEDRDGYEDADGCPDPDDDGDLIPDHSDDCPRSPEDRDGFEDEDGCPEPGGATSAPQPEVTPPASAAGTPPAPDRGSPPPPDPGSLPPTPEETP